jgi:hypothetical protein
MDYNVSNPVILFNVDFYGSLLQTLSAASAVMDCEHALADGADLLRG